MIVLVLFFNILVHKIRCVMFILNIHFVKQILLPHPAHVKQQKNLISNKTYPVKLYYNLLKILKDLIEKYQKEC